MSALCPVINNHDSQVRCSVIDIAARERFDPRDTVTDYSECLLTDIATATGSSFSLRNGLPSGLLITVNVAL